MRPALTRGQAATELALASLVLVSLFWFALGLSELGFVRLSLQAATRRAAWASTHARVERRPDAVTAARLEAAAARAARRDASAFRSAVVDVQQLDVRCRAGAGPSLPVPPLLAPDQRDLGGVRCQGRAFVAVAGVPEGFLDGSFFTAPHADPSPRAMRTAPLVFAVGDFGLAGEDESRTCLMHPSGSMRPCRNLELLARVAAPFERTSRRVTLGAGSAFAAATLGASPENEDLLHLSVPGEETRFLQTVSGPASRHRHPDNAWRRWPTTQGGVWPFGGLPDLFADAYRERREEWLGGPGW